MTAKARTVEQNRAIRESWCDSEGHDFKEVRPGWEDTLGAPWHFTEDSEGSLWWCPNCLLVVPEKPE